MHTKTEAIIGPSCLTRAESDAKLDAIVNRWLVRLDEKIRELEEKKMAYEIGTVGRVTLTRCTSRCDACGQVKKAVSICRMSGMYVTLCDTCFDACDSHVSADRRPKEPDIVLID